MISTILRMETPMKRPRRPPQLARKSVWPYNSDRLDVMNWVSLKKMDRRANWTLEERIIGQRLSTIIYLDHWPEPLRLQNNSPWELVEGIIVGPEEVFPIKVRLGCLRVIGDWGAGWQTVTLRLSSLVQLGTGQSLGDFPLQEGILCIVVALNTHGATHGRVLVPGHGELHAITLGLGEIGQALQFAVLLRVHLEVAQIPLLVEEALSPFAFGRNSGRGIWKNKTKRKRKTEQRNTNET